MKAERRIAVEPLTESKRIVPLYAIRSTKKSSQQETLTKLIHQARYTEFGMYHDFKGALKSNNVVKSFQESVPLTNYERFYEDWLERVTNGETDLIWPGPIKYFALSSGTTKGGSKYIPVSEAMLRQFKRTSFQQVSEINTWDLSSSLIKSKALIVGGSTTLRYEGNVRMGDLSGILAKNKSWVFSSISKPGKKISQLTDWEEKMDRIVEKAPKWNIGVIAGVPSWVSLLIERILKRYQLNSIHEIWPNLQLYVHGGIFLDPYKDKIDKMCSRPLSYQNTFLASEGYFGYQKDLNNPNMTLLTKHGIFYEFIEASHFESLRYGQLENVTTLTLNEVQENIPYCLVITTCAGLWRYNLGDLIVFDNVATRQFRIIGRVSYNLNICGEHLSEENLSMAVVDTGRRYGTEIQEFCSYPNRKTNRHEWYIGVDRSIPESEFEVYLDERLKQLNDDYATSRKFILKRPKVKTLPIDKFYEFMSIHHHIGSQSKFPRVLNETLVNKWQAFLSNGNGLQDDLS
ncbi:MAG: GH3 auxin-responsive promoter family protein [Crocinitomicaceae bacterium]